MKKRLPLGVGLLLTGFALALMLPPEAASAARARAKRLPPNVYKDTNAYWAVSAVDTTANTIELQMSNNSSNLTLKVNLATYIEVDGKPNKLADLKKGMKVNFSANGEMCSRLEAVPAPANKKKKK